MTHNMSNLFDIFMGRACGELVLTASFGTCFPYSSSYEAVEYTGYITAEG